MHDQHLKWGTLLPPPSSTSNTHNLYTSFVSVTVHDQHLKWGSLLPLKHTQPVHKFCQCDCDSHTWTLARENDLPSLACMISFCCCYFCQIMNLCSNCRNVPNDSYWMLYQSTSVFSVIHMLLLLFIAFIQCYSLLLSRLIAHIGMRFWMSDCILL